MATSMRDAWSRHVYGPDPSQFADRYRPAGERRPGTVLLLHGGWWGPKFGADHLAGAAADLARRGWVAWNIEYRRLGLAGGYPSTLEDVAAAIDSLGTHGEVDLGRVVAIGHSAGGHLATWAAGRAKLATGAPGAGPGAPSAGPGAPGAAPVVGITGVISLAGVVDLEAAAHQKLGNGAVLELLGGGPGQWPERYAVADPLGQVPIPAAVRCVHARADDRVPFAQSVTYVEAARAAGQDAGLLEVGGDHFTVADPLSPTWPTVVEALEDLTSAG